VKGHQSEVELSTVPEHWFNCIIVNQKTGLSALQAVIDALPFAPRIADTKYYALVR
jgi:hypothetical protein